MNINSLKKRLIIISFIIFILIIGYLSIDYNFQDTSPPEKSVFVKCFQEVRL